MEEADGEQNGAKNRMQKDETPEEDDEFCHQATIIMPQPAVETSAIQTQVQYKVSARLLNFLPHWRSLGQSDRILRGTALIWRNEDSAHILDVLKHKTAFKRDQEAHSSLSKIIYQELEDDVITQVPDSYVKCWNQIFAIPKMKGG
ncbi:MAG: hypothetical protein EZS28_020879 [Streblomastix strix]|uniref:Uncharacterized protein n=1 Tax=Streblomastix strix TaxID=222440 RepID=A0A5J4VMA8_9EUKA|nr:MAG: hypothetical protein EZS28_020879 [Streblomastix strix]